MTEPSVGFSRQPLISDQWGVKEWTEYLEACLALQDRGEGTKTTEACVRMARRKIEKLSA